jgi:DNA-directed RNA polymerase subunit L
VFTNTTRFNNEILKQRLSCIPIHISDLKMPLQNYIMEVDVENLTDTIMFVTTKDFKVKNITTNEYLNEKDRQAIFPPNNLTGYYIDFVRLRPKISDEIPGEKLQFTCEFSISNAKVDGMFNVVSTCAYQFTLDNVKIEEELSKKIQGWKDQGYDKHQIDFEEKNWRLLDAKRIFQKDSFDFVVQSVGVFGAKEIVQKACSIIIKKLEDLIVLIDTDELNIIQSVNTLKNAFDITLENEDYTIGKILEFLMYTKFFEELGTLSFCGFKKMHPHDSDSIIRLAYKNETDNSIVKQNLKMVTGLAVEIYTKIKNEF